MRYVEPCDTDPVTYVDIQLDLARARWDDEAAAKWSARLEEIDPRPTTTEALKKCVEEILSGNDPLKQAVDNACARLGVERPSSYRRPDCWVS